MFLLIVKRQRSYGDVHSCHDQQGYNQPRPYIHDPLRDGLEMCIRDSFYADAGDTAAYSAGEYRGGYWAEAYTVRDAEKYKKTDAGKNVDVVDIKDSDFSADSKTLYVDSTFYDYYTDYELNGNNRDSYPGENKATQRNWVTFRQLSLIHILRWMNRSADCWMQ